jgi:hypothetical protein
MFVEGDPSVLLHCLGSFNMDAVDSEIHHSLIKVSHSCLGQS